MQALSSAAIVVRVVDYGEADRVATFLTESAGKVTALARGARRSKRRFSSLEVFASGAARLREGRGELWSLESFDVVRGFPHLPLDMVRMAHAAYACELAREMLLPQHADPAVYGLLFKMLSIIDGGTDGGTDLGGDTRNDRGSSPAAQTAPPRTAHLRVYELALLGALGLSPALDRCVSCDRGLDGDGDEEGGDQLDLRRGGVICGRCGESHAPGRRPLPPRVRRLLLKLQRCSLDGLDGLDGLDRLFRDDDAPRAEAWTAARDAIQAILVAHLGKPLRSVEFIGKLNAVRP